MLEIVGAILQHGAWVVRCVTFDAHHSHNFVREVLLGQFYNVSQADLADIPFFRDLSWEALPEHPCPHLPLQLCRHAEEFFGVLPGCCDLSALFSMSVNGSTMFYILF